MAIAGRQIFLDREAAENNQRAEDWRREQARREAENKARGRESLAQQQPWLLDEAIAAAAEKAWCQ